MAKLISYEEATRATPPADGLISYEEATGATSENQTGGFMPAAKQAIGAGIKGLGQAAADFVPGVSQGNGLSSYGQSVIDANPTKIHSLSDIADSPWQTVKEATGNALGSMGPMLGARAAGMGITAAAPFTGPAAPIVAGVGQLIANAGPIVAAAAPSFGGIREQQIASDPNNEADAKSKAIALLGAGTVGLIESKFGPQEWALAAMKKGGLEELANRLVPAGASIPSAIGKGFARGAAVEGAEELVQNPIEQLASYQDPTTQANVLDTLHGGAMGAIGGGVLGGGMAGTARAVSGPIGKAADTADKSGATFKAEFDRVMQEEQALAAEQAKATKQGSKNEQSQKASTQGAAEVPQGPIVSAQESGQVAGPYAPVNEEAQQAGAAQPAGGGLSQSQIVQPGAATPAVDDEFAQFAMDEAKSLDDQRHEIAGQQAIARRAKLEAVDGRVEAQRKQQAEANRLAVMDSIDLPAMSNPVAAFEAGLSRAGIRQSKATQAEVEQIGRRVSALAGLSQPEPDIPSLPNELELPDKQKAQAAPSGRRMQVLIRRVQSGARIKGGKLLNKNGMVTANLTADEEAALREYVKVPRHADVAPDLADEKLNREWTAFSPESGSLGIPRSEMPQIKADHRGAMTNFMNARGVQHQKETVDSVSLHPTQLEFSPAKVKKAMGFDGGDRSILVSSDSYVLDGHHQWLAKRQRGEQINIIRLGAPIRQLISLAHEFPSSQTAEGAKTIAAGMTTPAQPTTGGILPQQSTALDIAPYSTKHIAPYSTKNAQEVGNKTANALQGRSQVKTSQDQSKAVSKEGTEHIDLSSRTDKQLAYLSTNGRPGYKEAAIAEIAKRAETSQPAKVVSSLPPSPAAEMGNGELRKVRKRSAKTTQSYREREIAQGIPYGGWVLRNKKTGEVVMETRDPAKVAALNTDKYEAVPIIDHLSGLSTNSPVVKDSFTPSPAKESQTPEPKVAPTVKDNLTVQDAEQPKAYDKAKATDLAKRMTKKGVPSEAYPHPTIVGKYAIRKVEAQESVKPASEEAKPTMAERRSAAQAKHEASIKAKAAEESRKIAASAPKVADLSQRMRAAMEKATGARRATLEARIARLEAAKPVEQKVEKPLWKRTVADAVGPQVVIPEVDKYPRLEKIARDNPERLTDTDNALLDKKKKQVSARAKALREYKPYLERANAHYAAVKDAIARGETIPDEVKAGYPHLFKDEQKPVQPAKAESPAGDDLRGYAYAIVKDGRILTRGSFPSPKYMEASDDTKLSKWRDEAKQLGADLYIGGYPQQTEWKPQEGLIFGMTWEELRDRQQKKAVANLPIQGKMPKDAVLVFNGKAEAEKPAQPAKPEPDAKQVQSAASEGMSERDKRYAAIRERYILYWKETAKPAMVAYLNEYESFGADRLERNIMKSKGLSALEWLKKIVAKKPTWDHGRKVGSTGIEMLSRKGLWPTDDGKGERLRKAMLAAVRAYKNAPMWSSDMEEEVFGNPAENPEADDTRFNVESSPFYSALSREIAAANIKAGPALSWKGVIRGLINSGKVKADEVEWSGLNEWLDLQQGKITKDQVSAFVDANGVQVQDVVLSDTAKYADYQIPGGDNYREVLLTLPRRETTTGDVAHRMFGKQMANLSEAERDAVVDEMRRIGDSKQRDFQSNHWDQTNVLAHIRVNDRTDADGKRVLFVEEIQSDWGQQGKKDGFKGTPEGAKRFFGINDDAWSKMDNEDRQSYIAEMDSKRGAVPAAPFVTNTDKWLALALKRIIKMAADGGYDRVAFVNGEQSAERYDLSKHIQSVRWWKDGIGRYNFAAFNGGNEVMRQVSKDADEVADYLGKEVAKKIVDGVGVEKMVNTSNELMWGKGNVGLLESLDLKVGGEGMRAFYDKIVPAALKDVLRKVGGNSTISVVVKAAEPNPFRMRIASDGQQFWVSGEDPSGNIGNESALSPRFDSYAKADDARRAIASGVREQPGFNITPIMRERAAGGMPLFNRNGQTKISPADSAVYEMARDGKSAAEILDFLGKASRNGFNRYLANALRNLGVSSTIKIDSMGGWNFNQSKHGAKYAAAYSPKTDTIALFTPREAERHALHELTHAATLKAIEAGGRAALEMKRLFEYVKASGKLDGMYGMTNLDEFVAEAFSNPEFQRALKNVMAPRGYTVKTAWDAFVRFVARIVGINTPALQSALDKAMVLGAELMRENAKLSGKGGNTRFSQESDTINVDGTERPRTNSNGKPIAQTDEALRKFWRWFGSSRVTDEQGRPLIVYHGTASDVAKFAPGNGSSDGFHFSSSPAAASRFAQSRAMDGWKGANVVPAYLAMQNPKAVAIASNAEVSDAQEGGYDGLAAKGGHYVAISAEQIKSATSNQEFSPDNPDIRFSEADEDANKGESYKSGSVSTYSLPKSLAKSLHAASPNASAFVAKSGDAILLSELVIPKEERGGGSGSAFMAELTRYADENGMNIVLTADGDYGGSKIGQQRFYRRHGFVPNAGRNKDFRYRENMIRRPADAIRYNVADDGQWQSTDPGLLDDVIYKLQHKQIDTRRTVQAITKAIGDIADKYNPELKESLYHGRAANETRKFLDFELRPLTSRMIALGVDTPTLETFLWARHAEERNAHIAKINPRMPDGGSGLTNAQAKQLLAGNDVTINGETIAGVPQSKLDELGELSAMADAMLDKSRELLVENGLETRATIDAWKSDYPHYVPLHREEFEDDRMTGRGLGMSVKGPSGKRAIGSDKPVGNILAAIVSQRELYITRAEKNRVGNALYGLATTAPNEEFWKAVDPAANANRDAEALWAQIKQRMTKLASMPNGDPDLEAIIDGMKAQHKAMMKKAIPGMKKVVDSLVSLGLPAEMAERVLAEPKELAINPRTGMVVERVNPLLRHLDNVVATRINGRDVFVVFDARDKRASRMAIAMKNLDADQLGFLLGNMAKATRYFAAINTQFNPIFGVTNFVRDIQTAMLNLSSTPLADHKKEVATRSLSAMLGIYSDLRAHRAGNLPSSKWAAMFERFKQAGGATGYRDMFETLSDRSKDLQDELKKMSMSKGRRLFTLGQSNPVFAWLSDYNEMMENSVRVAAFSVGIEQGLSDDKAASLAKELTVNFNKKGQVAAQAGAMYAFFNAAVQGSARIAQTLFVNRDGKVSLSSAGKKIVSGGIMLGVAQAFLGALAGWDDEDPPQFVRERSLIIPLGDHYFSVPMPLGFNVLPNIGRITAEFAMSGFKDPAKRIGSLLNVLADTLNPIGNAGVSLQTIAPTVIDPLAALAENKDWTGKPIKRMSFNEEAAGYKNAKDTATVWSKWIAEGLNYLSGGTEHKAGLSSPTPDQIDYLIGQVTGGVGREISKAVQSSTSVFSGEDLPLYKVPLVGKFVGDTKGNAADASRFYANVRELKAHKAELDGRRKAGQDVAEYLRDNPDARLVVLASRIERRVQELRRAKRELVDQGAPKDRVKQAEDQIAALMKALNSRVQANQRAA